MTTITCYGPLLPLPLMVPCAELSISSRAYIHQVRAQEHYKTLSPEHYLTSSLRYLKHQQGHSYEISLVHLDDNGQQVCKLLHINHSLDTKLTQIQELGNWESKILGLCMGERIYSPMMLQRAAHCRTGIHEESTSETRMGFSRRPGHWIPSRCCNQLL